MHMHTPDSVLRGRVSTWLLPSVRAAGLQYPNYTPFKLPNLTLQPFTDRGRSSSPEKHALLSAASSITHLTPEIGTELSGLQLTSLISIQKNDLARLVAERGVVFLRDQDMTVHQQIVHPIYKDETAVNGRSHQIWHSDVSYEVQPPGVDDVADGYVACCGAGGGYAVYESLSPKLRSFLETLEAKHSGLEQAEKALKTNGCLRRDPIKTNHPVVRTHPVTDWKTLYVNENFTKESVGIEKRIGDALFDSLYRTIAEGYEFQVRWKWTPNAVAIWDNRATFHTGIFDYFPHLRYGLRVAPQAEKPYLDPNSKTRRENLQEQTEK
ncbi:hypothetical protein BJX70DRAFT_390479 [Aspergillus crustosus]